MRISAQDIFDAAKAQGKSPAAIALLNGQKPDLNMWPSVTKDLDVASESFSEVDLPSIRGIKGTFIGDFAKEVARSVQFPVSTAFLHMLGCLSSACSHRFSMNYLSDDLHPGLYVIGAQPPATGKSAVNGFFSKSIKTAFTELNKKNAIGRAKVKKRIAELREEIKQDGPAINPNKLDSIMRDISVEQDNLIKFPVFNYGVSDVTPEALGHIAAEASGNFTLISDEATAINTVLGMSYGNEGRITNNETVLKGWDGGHVSTVRIGREAAPFFARGAISVLAQSETILSILKAGERGNGIAERFMLINERSNLGKRKYVDEHGNSLYEPVPKDMIAKYSLMVHAMVIGDPVELKLHPSAMQLLGMEKDLIEPELDGNGKFSSQLLRGVMGKADKQICKLAQVLHIAKEWQPGGSQGTVIPAETVSTAINLFKELSGTFINSAQAEGYAGKEAELKKVMDKILSMSAGGKAVKFAKLYQSLRNVVPFKGSDGFAEKLKGNILPVLEGHNFIVCVDKDIHINPELI